MSLPATPPAASRRWLPWLVIALAVTAQALWLWQDGRFLICECGRVRLFAGTGDPKGVSQHIADWYTPSHVIHGLVFFGLLWLVARRLSFGWRLAIATLIEVAWELIENSDYIIERYRAVTVSVDYNGDTVLNSLSDVGAMMLGFVLARFLPLWASIALIVGFEILTAFVIRDGLILNIVMLLWPIPAILHWQAGG